MKIVPADYLASGRLQAHRVSDLPFQPYRGVWRHSAGYVNRYFCSR
jgi:hypothetical protein